VQARDKDAARTPCLEQSGFRVLRFWNNDVLTHIDAVLQVIAAATQAPPSQPPPGCAQTLAGGGAGAAPRLTPLS
jgi:hypothetical protein